MVHLAAGQGIEMYHVGKVCKATLELPDGTVLTGLCSMANVEMSMRGLHDSWIGSGPIDTFLPQQLEWRMILEGIGRPLWELGREEMTEQIKAKMTAAEWRCDFCNAVMQREQRQCTACGAWRSFLYE